MTTPNEETKKKLLAKIVAAYEAFGEAELPSIPEGRPPDHRAVLAARGHLGDCIDEARGMLGLRRLRR